MIPQGTDLTRHSRDDPDAAAALNSRPRKTLDWRSSTEALDELLSNSSPPGVATTP